MPKYKVTKGKIHHSDAEGKTVVYRIGDVLECESYVVANLRDQVELVSGEEKLIDPKPPTPSLIAHLRSDGKYDVVNDKTGEPFCDYPLSEAEAQAVADALGEGSWTDLKYEGSPEPYYLQKIKDALPGKPSYNVIDGATGEPVNAEPIGKSTAEQLLAEKLKG